VSNGAFAALMGIGSGAEHIKFHAPLYSLGPELYVYHPTKPRVLKVISPNCTIPHLNCTVRCQRVSKVVNSRFPPNNLCTVNGLVRDIAGTPPRRAGFIMLCVGREEHRQAVLNAEIGSICYGVFRVLSRTRNGCFASATMVDSQSKLTKKTGLRTFSF